MAGARGQRVGGRSACICGGGFRVGMQGRSRKAAGAGLRAGQPAELPARPPPSTQALLSGPLPQECSAEIGRLSRRITELRDEVGGCERGWGCSAVQRCAAQRSGGQQEGGSRGGDTRRLLGCGRLPASLPAIPPPAPASTLPRARPPTFGAGGLGAPRAGQASPRGPDLGACAGHQEERGGWVAQEGGRLGADGRLVRAAVQRSTCAPQA